MFRPALSSVHRGYLPASIHPRLNAFSYSMNYSNLPFFLNSYSTNNSKPSLWTRFKHELTHYKEGSIKFGQETKASFVILLKLYNSGTVDSLLRRERMQLARTGADMIRLIPFSIFVIVPFLEFLLPVFVKIFPNMLPSTFENPEAYKSRLDSISRSRKAAHDALHLVLLDLTTSSPENLTMSPAENSKSSMTLAMTPYKQMTHSAKKLSEILQESHISTASQPIKERLEELGSLLKSNFISMTAATAESIPSQHLSGICSLLGLTATNPTETPIAKIVNSKLIFLGTDTLRRYKLRNHLEKLKKDDKLIMLEGVDSLLPAEVIQACHMRGIPTLKLDPSKSEERHFETLRADLQQWLDLTGVYGFPVLLVILSNVLSKK